MRRLLGLIPILAILALVLWLVMRDTTVDDTTTEPLRDVTERRQPIEAAERQAERSAGEPKAAAPSRPPNGRTPEDELLLSGVVVDDSRAPIAGAEVLLQRRPMAAFTVLDLEKGRDSRVIARQTTPGDGRFSFRVKRARQYDLTASARGYSSVPKRGCYGGQNIELVMQIGSCSVAGRVFWEDSNEPVGDVQVRAFAREDIASTRTAADGSYRLIALPAGRLTLDFIPARGIGPSWQRLELVPGQPKQHDVAIRRGPKITGSVVDAVSKLPIAGAEVGEGWTFRRTVRTDATGRYEALGWPAPGYHDLHARAPGYSKQALPIPKPRQPAMRIDFELPPAGSVKGRVLGVDRKPIAGVYVAAVASEMHAGEQQTDWQSTKSTADGRFRIESVRTDLSHALLVSTDGFATLVYDLPERVAIHGVVDVGDITMQRPACLEGVVVDKDGEPIQGAALELSGFNHDRFRLLPPKLRAARKREGARLPGEHYVEEREATSDAKGRFRYADLAAGTYRMVCRVRGGPETTERGIELTAGQVRDDIRLAVDLGLSISGRVETPDGAPIEAIVHLWSGNDQKLVNGNWVPKGEPFRFRGLEKKKYNLVARPVRSDPTDPDYFEGRTRDVEPGSENIVVRLEKAAYVSGIVRSAGKPASNLVVAACTTDGGKEQIVAYERVGHDGRFRLKVRPGSVCTLVYGPPRTSKRTLPAHLTMPPDPKASQRRAGVRAGTDDVELVVSPNAARRR